MCRRAGDCDDDGGSSARAIRNCSMKRYPSVSGSIMSRTITAQFVVTAFARPSAPVLADSSWNQRSTESSTTADFTHDVVVIDNENARFAGHDAIKDPLSRLPQEPMRPIARTSPLRGAGRPQ